MKLNRTFIIGLLTLAACSKHEEPLPTPLVADFDLPTLAETGIGLQFNNTSQNATHYKWGFGDGSSAVGTTQPQHLYATRGGYLVKLTAYRNTDSASVTKRLLVKPYDRFSHAGIPATSTYITRGQRQERFVDFSTGTNTYRVTSLPTLTLNVVRISPDTLRVNGFLAIARPGDKSGNFPVNGFGGSDYNTITIYTIGDSIALNEISHSGHFYFRTDTHTGPRRP